MVLTNDQIRANIVRVSYSARFMLGEAKLYLALSIGLIIGNYLVTDNLVLGGTETFMEGILLFANFTCIGRMVGWLGLSWIAHSYRKMLGDDEDES